MRRDSGAVAVIVALMAVLLFGMAAFAVDFGRAYNSKRQLATAADSASLTAAAEYGKRAGNCTTLSIDPAARSAADTAAAKALAANEPDAGTTGSITNVGCADGGKTVRVDFSDSTNVQTFFANLFNVSNVNVNRDAAAVVGVPPDVTGLRPYVICVSTLATMSTTTPAPVYYPDAACGRPPSGNWYSVDCPEDGLGNSTPVLAYNTQYGCDSDISIIDTSAAGSDVLQQEAILRATCSPAPKLSADPGCLTGNTGNLGNANIDNAFDAILGKTILLPVVDQLTVLDPNGNNATYPVKAFVGAVICGYRFQNDAHRNIKTDGACTGAAYPSPPVQPDYLILKKTNVQTSGSSKPTQCALGDPTCDFGVRRTLLVK